MLPLIITSIGVIILGFLDVQSSFGQQKYTRIDSITCVPKTSPAPGYSALVRYYDCYNVFVSSQVAGCYNQGCKSTCSCNVGSDWYGFAWYDTCETVWKSETTTLVRCVDNDGDGHAPPPEGDDCNDSDATWNPEGQIVCPGNYDDDKNCNGVPDGQDCQSPILIDTLGNGFALTLRAQGVLFDLGCTGSKQQLPWTVANSDDAWLALDRNGNGIIDDGSELFGNKSPQPASVAPNGFVALAVFDQNGDGVIDDHDLVFSSLRLWRDLNHNGVSETSELFPLPALDVSGIELAYKEAKRSDQYGNWWRYRAKVEDPAKSKVGRWAWDVFLSGR
jgi:hypothetical protein